MQHVVGEGTDMQDRHRVRSDQRFKDADHRAGRGVPAELRGRGEAGHVALAAITLAQGVHRAQLHHELIVLRRTPGGPPSGGRATGGGLELVDANESGILGDEELPVRRIVGRDHVAAHGEHLQRLEIPSFRARHKHAAVGGRHPAGDLVLRWQLLGQQRDLSGHRRSVERLEQRLHLFAGEERVAANEHQMDAVLGRKRRLEGPQQFELPLAGLELADLQEGGLLERSGRRDLLMEHGAVYAERHHVNRERVDPVLQTDLAGPIAAHHQRILAVEVMEFARREGVEFEDGEPDPGATPDVLGQVELLRQAHTRRVGAIAPLRLERGAQLGILGERRVDGTDREIGDRDALLLQRAQEMGSGDAVARARVRRLEGEPVGDDRGRRRHDMQTRAVSRGGMGVGGDRKDVEHGFGGGAFYQ